MKKKHIFICTVSFILIVLCFAIIKFAGSIIKLYDTRQSAGTVLQNEAAAPTPTPVMLTENADQPAPETITPATKPDTNEAVPTIIAENGGFTEGPPK